MEVLTKHFEVITAQRSHGSILRRNKHDALDDQIARHKAGQSANKQFSPAMAIAATEQRQKMEQMERAFKH